MRQIRLRHSVMILGFVLAAQVSAATAAEQRLAVVVREESACRWCRMALAKPDQDGLALARDAETAVLMRIAGQAPKILRGAVLRKWARPLYVVADESPAPPAGDAVVPPFKPARSLEEVEDEAIRSQKDAYYLRFKNIRSGRLPDGNSVVGMEYEWGVVNAKEAHERRAGAPITERTLFGGFFRMWAQREGTRIVLYDARIKVLK